MTARLFIISFFLLQLSATAQNRKFLQRVDATQPQFYEQRTGGAGTMDLVHFDPSDYAGLVIGTLNGHRNSRSRPALEQDSLLNRIALAAVLSYDKNKYIYSGEWRKERHSIKYALHHQHSKYKMYWAHAFALDVLDLELRKAFYCDRKNPESDLFLYEGKAPLIRNPEHEDYVQPVPLSAINEQQFALRLMEVFSGQAEKELLEDVYSRIGVAIKVDKRSLNSSYRPRVFVIVIFAGKRLQEVRVPEAAANSTYNKIP